MRLYPPIYATVRKRNKHLVAPDIDANFEVGTRICIPIYSIHHDPRYYPNPETFDPDRFSPEETAQRHPFTFLPFGGGPRKCIGK